MKWPPYLMYLKIQNRRHRFGIWIPLFIIVPIGLIFLLALFLIALPFILLSLVITWRWEYWDWMWSGISGLFSVLNSLPGLRVVVDDREQKVQIVIY